jgi:hypothetical protein
VATYVAMALAALAGAAAVYLLDPDGLGELRAYLDGFWNRALASFRAAVEQLMEEG